MPLFLDDTIAAVATPPGNGGVGVVRISGPGAHRILERIVISSRDNPLKRPGFLHHGRVMDPENGAILDEVLSVHFVAPRSFTGQDVAEIHAHGGRLNLEQILALILRQGARAAGPGEFTLRAFINRRMDLTRAEAVRDLIGARTTAALNASRRQLLGETERLCEDARREILTVLAHIDAMVDFPDEDFPPSARATASDHLSAVRGVLSRAARTYARGRLLTEGADVMIVGTPNVGKSSLLNRLLGRDRAIVSETPGTTRDLIEATLDIGGVPVRLVDSAGLREGGDAVESQGVLLARERLSRTDWVLWVLDASRPLTPDDRAIADRLPSRPGLLVLNKADLSSCMDREEASSLAPGWPVLSVSALTGEGLDLLEEALQAHMLAEPADADTLILTSARQKNAFLRAIEALERAERALADMPIWELVAADLGEATQALGEVVGAVTPDDILNEIFSTFCIGK